MKTTIKFAINLLVLAIITSTIFVVISTTRPSYASMPALHYQGVGHIGEEQNPPVKPDLDRDGFDGEIRGSQCDCEDEMITWEFSLEVSEGELNAQYSLYAQNAGETVKIIIDDSVNNDTLKPVCDVVGTVPIQDDSARFIGEGYIECITPSFNTINTALNDNEYSSVGLYSRSKITYMDVEFSRKNQLNLESRHIPLVHVEAESSLIQPTYKMGLTKNRSSLWSPYLTGLSGSGVGIDRPFYEVDLMQQLHKLRAERTDIGKLKYTATTYHPDVFVDFESVKYKQAVWRADSQVIRIGYAPNNEHLIGDIHKVIVDPCMLIMGD